MSETIILSNEDFDILLEKLDAEPKVLPKLAKLMKEENNA